MLDAVLVINLDSRPDKWEKMKEHWGAILPEGKLHRISAVRGTDLPGYKKEPWFRDRTGDRAVVCAGQAGCVLSHRKAVQYAKERGYRRILVLEDDILLDSSVKDSFYDKLVEVIEDKMTGGILYLGCHHAPQVLYKEMEGEGNSVYRISGALGTYAFIIDSNVYDVFLKHYPAEEKVWSWIAYYKAVDYWLSSRFSRYGKIFAVYPEMVVMPPSFSDIAQEEVDYEISTKQIPLSVESYDVFQNKLRKRNDIGRVVFTLVSCIRWIKARFMGFSPFRRKRKARKEHSAESK